MYLLSYIKDYKKDGIKSIYKNNYKGQKSRLEPFTDKIIEEFENNPIKSAKEGCARIKEKFNIEITETPLKIFLKKKNLVIKNPKQNQRKQTKNNNNYFWLRG